VEHGDLSRCHHGRHRHCKLSFRPQNTSEETCILPQEARTPPLPRHRLRDPRRRLTYVTFERIYYGWWCSQGRPTIQERALWRCRSLISESSFVKSIISAHRIAFSLPLLRPLFEVGMIHSWQADLSLQAFELCLQMSSPREDHPSVARVLYEIDHQRNLSVQRKPWLTEAIAILLSNSMDTHLKSLWMSMSRSGTTGTDGRH
jgi:hypothetical protein